MLRELRPRFEVSRNEDADVLLERIRQRLRSGAGFDGYVAEGRATIHVPSARQRLWSAELRVELIRQGESTLVQGMYAPHPHVWVTYVVLLAALVVGATVATVFALAEWSLNQRPVALYALVPLLLVGLAAYATAFIGQRFATHEMDELRAFLDETLESGAPLPSHIRNLRPSQDERFASEAG